jgi:hypothetical protein
LAITRVLLPAADPPGAPEPPLEQPAAAMAIAITPRLRVRGQVARSIGPPTSSIVDSVYLM